jgi:NAD(P)-dependent dehydrogenase (short-subunit alcohol dehydrogenase family)
MAELSGKTTLVTGASKGIGAAIAAMLADRGAHVIAHYGSDRGGAEEALAAAPAERVRLIQADFADPAAAETFWAEAEAWRGRIDVLVNNAAVMRLGGASVEAPQDDWDTTWDEAIQVNLLAPARLTREAVRHFLAHGGGTLITLSSWVVHRGASMPDGLAYAATKAGITAVTKTIARAYAKQGVLAYCVAPGVVRTKMSEDSAAVLGGEAAVTAGLTMGEWVPPTDIAEVVAFLATSRARHLTGATIDINGASYVR